MRNTKRTMNKQNLSKTESTSTCTLSKYTLFPFISIRFVFVKSSCFVSFGLVFSLLFCSARARLCSKVRKENCCKSTSLAVLFIQR